MGLLIAEDLLLLLLDDEKGTAATGSNLDVALGGAVLAELALHGAVSVSEKTGLWHTAKVRATPGVSVEDPVLADRLSVVAGKERSALDLVSRLGRGLRDRLAERLVERGLLEGRHDRVLGVFPRTRWPARDSTHEREVRRALRATLVEGAEPDQRTAALVALLAALNLAHRSVEHDGLSSREVRRRAKEVAEGAWAADAVSDSIRAATVATTAAVTAAVVAGGAAGS